MPTPGSNPTHRHAQGAGASAGSFANVLGHGRGSGTQEPDPGPPPVRERVRELFAWVNSHQPDQDRLAQLRAEHQTAQRLGLTLAHGHWCDLTKESGQDNEVTFTLVIDADTATVLAIIEMTGPGSGQLYLQDDGFRRRP